VYTIGGRAAQREIPIQMRLLPGVLLALAVSCSTFGQTYTIDTFAGNGTAGYSGDNGPATSAALNPAGIAVDAAGNLYIADSNRIRKISHGAITTVAGNGTYGFSGDNGPATSAQLFNPQGVAVDAAGNLYIADTFNNRIRKVSGGVITTVAGNGTSGINGDNIPATTAQLNWPYGVAVDGAGNLYIANTYNNRVCKVSGGIITTLAGNGTHGYGGDNGPATAAQLSYPDGVAVDAAGNVYIADTDNDRIRKVSGGVIATVAGNGTEGFSGDKGPATAAQLGWPYSVAVDAAGNLFIADTYNNRIRKVSGGAIATVGGDGTFGFGGDKGPATSAAVSPAGIAVDSAGNLYAADTVNYRIRILRPAASR
jgi:sugar lactone lactonase YvrE